MGMQVMPPGRDLTVQIGDAIDDWHLILNGAGPARNLSMDHRVIGATLTGQMGGKRALGQPSIAPCDQRSIAPPRAGPYTDQPRACGIPARLPRNSCQIALISPRKGP